MVIENIKFYLCCIREHSSAVYVWMAMVVWYAAIQTESSTTPEQKQESTKGTTSEEGRLYSLQS